MKNIEILAILDKLCRENFRGHVQLHFCDGHIGGIKIVQHINRREIDSGAVALAPRLSDEAKGGR